MLVIVVPPSAAVTERATQRGRAAGRRRGFAADAMDATSSISMCAASRASRVTNCSRSAGVKISNSAACSAVISVRNSSMTGCANVGQFDEDYAPIRFGPGTAHEPAPLKGVHQRGDARSSDQ
jgi:hypothetical protein